MKHTVSMNQNYQFRRMYKAGRCVVSPYFAAYIKKNKIGKNRLGITATKKIGNAVERNRARRLLKESYRLLETELPRGMDIVLVARKKTVMAKMQPVRESMRLLLQENPKGKRQS